MKLDIKITGEVKKAPTKITFSLIFKEKSKDYTDVIDKGSKQLLDFQEILKKLDIDLIHLKTDSYKINTINERIESNKGLIDKEKTIKYVFSHYEIVQSATLSIDYDIKKMMQLINLISQMENYPNYSFDFSLAKDEKIELENIALEKAITLAKEKVYTVLKATNNENYEIEKIEIVDSFRNSMIYKSKTVMGEMMQMANCVDIDNLANTICPDDINVSVNIVCSFNIS